MTSSTGNPLHKTLPMALLSWLMLAYTLALGALNAWPQVNWCLFKQLTHLPCVFCGLTRSFVLIGQGRLPESLNYHPLGLLFYPGMIAMAVLGLMRPAWALVLVSLLTRRPVVMGAIAVLAVCWLWKLGRPAAFW